MPNSLQIQVIFDSVDALVEVAIKEDLNTVDYLSHVVSPRIQVTPELLNQHLTIRDLDDAIESLDEGDVKTALKTFKEAFEEQRLPSVEILAALEQHPNYNPLNIIDLRAFVEKLNHTPIKPEVRSRFLAIREISLGVAEPAYRLRHLYSPFGFRKYTSPLNLNNIGPVIGIDEINLILKNYLEFHEFYWNRLGLYQKTDHENKIETLKKEKVDLEKEKAALAKKLEEKTIEARAEKFNAEILMNSLTNTDRLNATLTEENKLLKEKIEALEQGHPVPVTSELQKELIQVRKELAKAKASHKAILFAHSKTTSFTDTLYQMATNVGHFFSWFSKKPTTVLPTAKQTDKFFRILYKKDSKKVLKFLKKKEHLNISAMRNCIGHSPLHVAASHDMPEEVLKALLDRTDDINLLCDSTTPLMATAGAMKFAQNAALFLLKKGADPNIQNSFGYTLLHEAVTHNSPHLVAFLIKGGADLQIKVHSGVHAGKTALDLAKEKKLETISLIFDIYCPQLNQDAPNAQGNVAQPLIFNHNQDEQEHIEPRVEINGLLRLVPRP